LNEDAMTSHRENLDAVLADLPRATRRALKKAILRDADRCGICREPYPHAGRTWTGLLSDGAAATACERCVGRLRTIYGGGLYLSKRYPCAEALVNSRKTAGGESPFRVSAVELEVRLAETQRLLRQEEAGYAARHRLTCRRAGLPETGLDHHFLNRGEPWREDDRIWFEEHPDRSFRMRKAFPGEIEELERANGDRFPESEGRRPVVVVCQTEPGSRVRAPCLLPADVPVLDMESVVETMFEHCRRGERQFHLSGIIEEAMALERRRAELQAQ
jgi:hypothetical protein